MHLNITKKCSYVIGESTVTSWVNWNTLYRFRFAFIPQRCGTVFTQLWVLESSSIGDIGSEGWSSKWYSCYLRRDSYAERYYNVQLVRNYIFWLKTLAFIYVLGSMYQHPVTMKTGLSYALTFQRFFSKYAYTVFSLFCGSWTHETYIWAGFQVRGFEHDFIWKYYVPVGVHEK
jgi:hypothetical protein